MGSLSDFGENACLVKLVRQTATLYTPAATLYVALCDGVLNTPPSDTSTGANCGEVPNLYSYARTAITFGAPASRRVTQSGTVTFPTITGALGTASHYVIVDSGTYGAGNVLAWGSLTENKVIVNGNTPSIASGDIYIQFNALSGFGLSTVAAEGLLNWMFRNQTFTIAATYLGVANAVLTDATTGTNVTEPSGGSYARLLINASGGASPAWAAVSGNSVTNANIWQFVTPTAPWINGGNTSVVASFVASASSAGDILIYDNGITDQAVGTGDPVLYAQGAFIARIN